MAKRFIDTGFLDQKWIRKLPPEKKIFLIYLMLKCDNGGIIDLDFEDAEFWIGKKIGDLNFLPEGYLILIDDSSKYFMPKFIEWQYPNFPHSKVHQQAQAKEILIKNGVFNVDTQYIDLSKFYVNIKQSLSNTYLYGNDNVNGNVNGNDKEEKSWKNNFEIYLAECKEAYRKFWKDEELMRTQQRLNPGIDVKLSIEKGYTNFWSTELGWKHKKKCRSKDIDWKSTIINSIGLNKVYIQREDKPRVDGYQL
jgi:hypothetical protein